MKNTEQRECVACAQLRQKIEVLSADYEFELRKTNEDRSTEKALYEMAMQKDIRKWQQKYTKERGERDEDNKKWLRKVDEISKNHQNTLLQAKQNLNDALLTEKVKLDKEVTQYKATVQLRYHNELRELVSKHKQQVHELLEDKEQQLEQCRRLHQISQRQLSEEVEMKENCKKQEHEAAMTALKAQKAAEEKAHAKTLEDSRREKMKFYTEVYQLKSKLNEKDAAIACLNDAIRAKELLIEQMQFKLQQTIGQYEEQLKVRGQQECERVKEMQKQYESEQKSQIAKQLAAASKYEQALSKLEQKRKNECRLYESSLKEVRECMQQRPSRSEDVEEIASLREKLFKKEKQVEQLQHELHLHLLEMENKEDTYNKLFIPNVNGVYVGNDCLKKKENLCCKLKKGGRSVTTIREILHNICANGHPANLPSLPDRKIADKQLPKSNKIL